ncbi:hypothetical protein SAMN05216360_111206 [Methylobacterium phyllostachyos]|uniref:Uncharacterized protein n=1 Tax=Methylobacterium phyllostachyos TaxID=582672 RepID=A0A1H0EJG3_9HYPH|nr:hypothetical protein [Methylobacterium phyllostachyos]SDN82482.1 hypothetical protein SAMN05216360_111206 [Methylobacterium phyllostachyos]
MTDLVSDADCDACAREAAAAIEAVLDQRCPELKRAFWSAVAKHYRMSFGQSGQPPAAPRPTPEARPPA